MGEAVYDTSRYKVHFPILVVLYYFPYQDKYNMCRRAKNNYLFVGVVLLVQEYFPYEIVM